ncbi:MAG: flagellar motor protein MotB [Hydrogenophaga sp.]|uniref:flagellar motor protein MotB n=1 Tax=Hydrogenophaga sp. TaxID=1904254 RepID=UPI001D75C1F8|nr:flagellar motor protein MotB [Hydrogenophaga sp.]MBX3609692.1 flagellar motor protein MotB [Hydrogenophaga sp.]
MAGNGKALQPIIVKRIKKGGHAAHGGAWKIAYADFVTAMMAFFLLMWLLGSTAKGELEGIASYFSNPVKVSLMGGNGSGNSNSIIPGGGRDLSSAFGQRDSGDTERTTKELGAQMSRADMARKEQERIDALESKINALIAGNEKLGEYRSQIRMIKTPDGLQILIVDAQNRPMFDTGSALLKPYMQDILRTIGGSLGDVENRIAITGHTDALPFGNGDRGYSNWELSAERANASRRELVAGGLPDDKLRRVEGLAASVPLLPDKPYDPSNRRISILIMSRDYEDRMFPPALPAAPVPGAEPGVPDTPAAAAPAATEGPVSIVPPLQISANLTKPPETSHDHGGSKH